MRLLLDEHHDPEVARRLREIGHDVAAVAEREELRGRPDPDIFAAAMAEGRAVVTENVRDYLVLVGQAGAKDVHHAGVICTTERSYPRHRPGRDRLSERLALLLEEHPGPDALRDVVIWL